MYVRRGLKWAAGSDQVCNSHPCHNETDKTATDPCRSLTSAGIVYVLVHSMRGAGRLTNKDELEVLACPGNKGDRPQSLSPRIRTRIVQVERAAA